MKKLMKPVYIVATDLNDAWFQALWNLWEHGREYKIDKGSFEGSYRKAFDFVAGFIHNPHTRPLAPRMPEGSILSPPTDDQSIEDYFVNYLMRQELEEQEHYTYGGYINGNEKLCGLNQLDWICNHFRKVGLNTEHCFITIGTGNDLINYDIPYKNDSERRTTACLRGLDFRVIDNQLVTGAYFRSWDIIAFPENLGGITLLNEFVSQEIGVQPGPITFASKSLHAYQHAFKYIQNRLGK